MMRFDVVVAGGGIAGSTTAAALARRGLQVLVCEAGLPNERRLAGELLHPPGADNLERLGMLDALRRAGGVPVYGFALFRDATDPGTVLSYSEIKGGRPVGIALEHARLTRCLFDAAGALPGVTVWDRARVTGAEFASTDPVVSIKRQGEVVEVGARLVVSAEGRASKIREAAGIATSSEDAPFRMVGWKIPGGRLPYPGYGHVFIGGPTPILAYQVSRDDVRIMFELGLDDALEVGDDLLGALPEPFRGDVRRAMDEQPRATARFVGFRPSRFTATRLAVVGDAGGCVHPLIASGMSFCAADAARLAEAVEGPHKPLEVALQEYEAARRGPMRTRAALGPAMVEALCDPSPAMRLLRHGLFRYWNRSQRGRSISMDLLSTRESSMGVMAREYAMVCAHALTGLPSVVQRHEVPASLSGLARRTTGFLRQALL